MSTFGSVVLGDPGRPKLGRGPLFEDTPSGEPAVDELRLGRWWFLRPTVIYLLSRALTVVAMAAAQAYSGRTLRQEMSMWDGQWFLRAARYGWPDHLPASQGHVAASTIAFFPLFPLLIRRVSDLLGTTLLSTGISLSLVGGLFAMVAVWALVRQFADRDAADRATLLLALFPGSFVMSLVYAEGLVVTFVALGLLALVQRRWVAAGILGLLATATSPVALAFVPAAAWAAGRAVHDRRDWRALVAPLLAPLGFVAYMASLWASTGNALAWPATEHGGWHSSFSPSYPFRLLGSFVTAPLKGTLTSDLLVAGIAITVVLAVTSSRLRMPRVVQLYGLFAALLAACAAPVGLRPRFILLAFPLVLALGVRLRGRAYTAAAVISALSLVALTMFSVSSYAVFP